MRAAIVAHEFAYAGQKLSVRVSLGLAAAAEGDDVPDLVRRADTALYAAKQAGRDCAFASNGAGCTRIEPNLEAFREALERTIVVQSTDAHDRDSGVTSRRVRCRELDTRGFTFVAFQRPEADRLVVSSGRTETGLKRMARVVRVTPVGPAELPRYEVVCEYTSESPRPEAEDALQPA
jgi:hypothetical protein